MGKPRAVESRKWKLWQILDIYICIYKYKMCWITTLNCVKYFPPFQKYLSMVFPLKALCKHFIQIVNLLISSLHRPSIFVLILMIFTVTYNLTLWHYLIIWLSSSQSCFWHVLLSVRTFSKNLAYTTIANLNTHTHTHTRTHARTHTQLILYSPLTSTLCTLWSKTLNAVRLFVQSLVWVMSMANEAQRKCSHGCWILVHFYRIEQASHSEQGPAEGHLKVPAVIYRKFGLLL